MKTLLMGISLVLTTFFSAQSVVNYPEYYYKSTAVLSTANTLNQQGVTVEEFNENRAIFRLQDKGFKIDFTITFHSTYLVVTCTHGTILNPNTKKWETLEATERDPFEQVVVKEVQKSFYGL